jgi:ssDNA-binding Zn-finger/Zn-ribbon topoisomerase 1
METKSPQPKGTGGTSPKQSKVCPRCGGELIEGEMKGGLSHGRRAWACMNYPKCTHAEIERTSKEQAMLDALMREARVKKK